MKKDKKYLKDLEDNLEGIKDKYKDEIVSKYEKIIKDEKSKKRKITEILNELGNPKDVAKKEIELLGKESIVSKAIDSIKKFFSREKKKKKNNDYIKSEKKRIKNDIKEENKKLREEKRKNRKLALKRKLRNIGVFITKDISVKNKKEDTNLVEKKEVTITEEKSVPEEVIEDIEEEISNVAEIVSEKKIFESKKDRNKRILLKTLGVILTILLLFLWLWVTVVFIASLFAYLDGIRFVGINVILFGIDALLLWVVIMVNRAIFKKNNNLRLNLIVSIIFIVVIAFGIVLAMKQVSEIETVKDVSVKYSMTTKLSTYTLPNDINQKFTLTFNSNYKTQYVMNYDETLKDKIKVEVKYYECYYDYYVKETSNSSYISLKLDNRDRLSVYIDDLKDKLVFDNDELSRYVVRISINPNDTGRLTIND